MKLTVISILIAVLLIGGTVFFSKKKTEEAVSQNKNNVTMVGEKQIIEIKAKGGFSPEETQAKAGVPTVLRFKTTGTFDCSSSVRIPSLQISKQLSQTGMTEIDIGISQAGTLQGMCGMGMYPFEVTFN